LVAPTPDPQRLLPSLNVEQTSPDLQSPSLEHESHSPPELRQLLTGTVSSIRITSTYRVRIIATPPAASGGIVATAHEPKQGKPLV
jgi:hypothetical protein